MKQKQRNHEIIQRIKIFSPMPHLVFLVFVLGCGAGGSGGGHLKGYDLTGALDGYVYAPVGSAPVGARVAGAPQAGYVAMENATVTATCSSVANSARTQSGADAGHFAISGLPAGACAVKIEKAGYTPYQTTVSVTAGATTKLAGAGGITMNPASAGSLAITANMPGGTIVIDGTDTGLKMDDTTYTLNNLSTGSHTVKVNLSGYKEVQQQNVQIQAGATASATMFIQILNNKIFFVSERDSDFLNEIMAAKIYKMNPDGTNQERVTPSGLEPYGYLPSPSPDGTKVAFISTGEEGNTQIFIMNSDGTNIRQLTHEANSASIPSLSYDGKYIVGGIMNRPSSDCPMLICTEIAIYDINGKLIRQLTNNEFNDTQPSFSPDGKHVVFASLRPDNANYDVYIIDSDGNNETKLTEMSGTHGRNFYPSFSPDGRKILFYSDAYQPNGLYLMDIDGANKQLLLAQSVNEAFGYPHFSPDGQSIVFDTNLYDTPERGSEICRYDINSGTRTRLTFIPGIDLEWQPTWTP